MTSSAPSTPSQRLLVYGATGYTGKLVLARAAELGIDVLASGRNADKLKEVAAPFGFETRAVALDDTARLRALLDDFAAVLHIAGPFSATSEPMVSACLETNTHYLDVTGEIDVFESIARRDEEAKRAGVVLLPGVGFDVVPTDCLAAHTAARVESPRRLRLALAGMGGGVSRGTAKTAVESLGDGLTIRRDGILIKRPSASLERHFDFGAGPTRSVGMPWGDVATAFYSTGIPDIEVYFALSGLTPTILRASRLFTPLLRMQFVQDFLKRRVDDLPEGPSEADRAGTRTFILAEVEGEGGDVARSMLESPSGYALTPVAALEATIRAARGAAKPGFHTPATAFGADFVLDLEGCTRRDLD